MRPRRLLTLIPLTVAIATACRSTTSASGASAVVEGFYAAAIADSVTGAPTPDQLAKLAPYLSDTLRSLLAAARRQHDADAARAPDEKPAFAEGDLFSSLFEGVSTAEAIADSARGTARVVTTRMTYRGADPPVTWTDRVIVVTHDGRSVIDDIEYGGQWGFASKGTLRTTLEGALAGAAAGIPGDTTAKAPPPPR